MRSLRIIRITGVAAALLLSASPVLAEGPKTGDVGENREAVSTTTVRRDVGDARQEILKTVRADAESRVQKERGKAEERLKDIKDKEKQQLAQRLAKQFDTLNMTWTDHFIQLLDRYDALLQKMQDRAAIAATNGKDMTTVTAAIQAARAATVTARTAVVAQAAKTYSLTPAAIPTTTTATTNGQEKLKQALRATFQDLHKVLFKDLFALRDGPMTDARKAVQNALQTFSEGKASETKSNQ